MRVMLDVANFEVTWDGDKATRAARWERAQPGNPEAPIKGGDLTISLGSFEEAQAVLALIEEKAPGKGKAPRKSRAKRAVVATVLPPPATAAAIAAKPPEVPRLAVAPAPQEQPKPAAAAAPVEQKPVANPASAAAQIVGLEGKLLTMFSPEDRKGLMVRDVIVRMREAKMGDREQIIAACELLRASCPKLSKLVDMADKVDRVLAIAAEDDVA